MVELLPFGGLGFLLGFIWIVLLVGLAFYVYFALVLTSLAKKTNTPKGWLAWVPIANIYLVTQVAGISGLWTLAIFLAIVPFVGGIAIAGLNIWWWWKIAERVGRPGWWALLMLVPIANFVIMGMLAWSNPPPQPVPGTR